jgi:RHS repeat-associated protein
MKTIYKLKKLFILFLLFIISSFSFGQTTYSSTTGIGTYTTCPTSNFTTTYCGTVNDAYYRASTTTAQLRLRLTSISGNQITFQISKCSGTAFSNGTRFILKEEGIYGNSLTGIVCGNNYPNSTGITVTNTTTTTISYTYTATHTSGTKYLMGITIAPTSGDRYYTNAIGINATTLSPTLSCGAYSVNPSQPVQGQNATFQYSISNIGTGNYTGTLHLFWGTSAASGNYLDTYTGGLTPGAIKTFNFTTPAGLTSPPGNYVLGIADGTNLICSINVTVVAATPQLSCGSHSVTPTQPIQGQNATFQYSISNIGTGNYTGTLHFFWGTSAASGNYLDTYTGGLIPGAIKTFNFTTPAGLTSPPGNYILGIADGTNLICSINVTVVAAPSCITWTDTPPTGDKLIAANYLACNHIIQASQTAAANRNNGIKRELMAKVTYNSLYKDVTLTNPQPPAQYYPVPFTDMQGTPAWLKEVKTLAYLQWSDDITPFDRDFVNFQPDTLVRKKYAIKILLEAFNIPKSTATPSPFSDVSTTEAMYGYIKKAHELGLISGTLFNVDSNGFANVNITREDLFVVVWKLLTNSGMPTKPTIADLNNPIYYYVPGNNRMANSGKIPNIDQANFNHYQKTSFSIAGRGVSLDFTHTYNSFLTELPKGYFEESTSTGGQKFTPLGIGWTHTYNIYAQKVAGYTFGTDVEPDKLMVYYPDGSINTFNYATGVADGIGIYDVMSKTTITGGERITIVTKGQVSYVFENYNNGKFYFIKSIKDRNNNGVKCIYEASSTIPSVAKYHLKTVQEEFNNGSLGRSLTFGYASIFSPYLTSVTESGLGRIIHFDVDSSTKSLTNFTDAKGQITSYVYDDPNNYNKANLLTEIWLPKGNKIRNTYAQRKLISSQTLNTSSVATSTTAVNWTPNYTASGYNSTSTVVSQQSTYNPNPLDRTTKYTHNTLGNPTQIEAPTGITTFNSYDTGNNQNLPTSLTVNGQSSSISYDNKGNVLDISKNGITNSFTYTTKNDVLKHTDGRLFETNYTYDTSGNLTDIIRPSGFGNTHIARNSFGQVTDVTNPSSIVTHFGYDTATGLTNLVSSPQVAGVQTTSEYDNASRLTKTIDAMNKETHFGYDENDNLVDYWDAYNQQTHHVYDPNDNHIDIRNPKLEHQVNTYNPDDDMLASETFGSHVKSYTYNDDGSLATHTRGNGTFTYSYFPNGRLQSDNQTSYTYYTNGNINTITNSNGTLTLHYDANDRLDYYDDYYGNRVSYTYDANYNVKTIVYPGLKTVSYTYDAVNRCIDVTDWNAKNTHFDYFQDDRIDRVTLPNTSYAQYSYDSVGRPTGIANKKADGTIICAYTFGLRPDGNHETESITEPSIVAGLATITPQTVSYGTYPNNIIQSQGSTTYTNYLEGSVHTKGTDSFTYDLNDNMLTAPNSTFSYDGAGNRRAKTVSGVNTRYVLSILGMSQVLMETNSSNAVQNYYVYGPTGLLYRVKADNTTYSYYHYDYRGSTTAITNQAQTVTHSYSYDPFGKVLAKTEADANPFQYVGQHGVQYESPTLTFMRARYYDPTTGRFVSEDPIWALNLYPYSDNNPILKIDPKGENAIIKAGLGGMVWEGSKALYNSIPDVVSSLYFAKLAYTYARKGNYKTANILMDEANRLIWNANKKVTFAMSKGFATGVVEGLIGQYVKGFSEVQKFIDSNGTKILGKSGLNLFNLDMRLSSSKYIRDVIFGELGISSTAPVWQLADIFSSKK